MVFNKTFVNMSIDFISPSSLGFVFHSSTNYNFYDYRFTTNNYLDIPAVIPAINQLKPFDNNSFIVLSDQLMVCTINVGQISSIIYSNYTYILENPSSYKGLSAFTLASGSYYAVGIPGVGNNYNISIY